MPFTDLATEIVLHIVSFLGLDAFRLPLVCRHLSDLSQERIFWITVLSSARLTGQIPCPIHQDLSLLDLQTLRTISLHARRLSNNWSSPSPKLIDDGFRSMVFKTDSNGHSILFNIPGTRMVVVQHWTEAHTTVISCVNVWEHKIISECRLDQVSVIDWISRPHFHPNENRCSIALHHRRITVVIEVEYTSTTAVLRKILETKFAEDDDSATGSLALNSDLLARAYKSPNDGIQLVLCVLSSGLSDRVHLDVPDEILNETFAAIYFTPTHINILIDCTSQSYAFSVPYTLTPSAEIKLSPGGGRSLPPISKWPRPPHLRVQHRNYRCTVISLIDTALSIYNIDSTPSSSSSLEGEERTYETCIDAWDMNLQSGGKTQDFQPRIHTFGNSTAIDPKAAFIWKDRSCTLLLTDSSSHSTSLQLVTLGSEWDPKKTKSLQLPDSPPFLEFDTIEDLVIETGFGIVYLMEESGTLHGLFYA